ncbi:ring finger protein-like [Panthera uncia]|uniref:ring finger protein-like n=1 Tax=Panthera uncia TaxID=29064 RepID=UPI0020FFC05C|nr:ring finger protein-like [Panthera uncia]
MGIGGSPDTSFQTACEPGEPSEVVPGDSSFPVPLCHISVPTHKGLRCSEGNSCRRSRALPPTHKAAAWSPPVCPPVADTRVGRGGHVRAGADPVKTASVGPGAARTQHKRWGPGEVDFPGWGEAAAVSRSVPGPALTQRAALTFTAPTTLVTTLGTPPTHPDPCPGAPTHGPRDLSAGLPRPPSTGPERLAPPHPGLADEEVDGRVRGNTQGAGAGDSEPLLGATATACPWAGRAREGEEGEPAGEPGQEECPICTEPYGPSEHRLALLNCGHGLCVDCLHQLLVAAPSADLGRVCCPLCRQRTPMLEWEICQLQKELLQADGPQGPRPPTPPAPARRGPGPWASLEHRYQLRFLAGPVGGRGCLPFLPCPPCLGARLWALRERGPCSRRLVLLGLLALELLGLLLIFTPLMLLGLLFMLLDRAGH